jgi:hypothetical protein
MQSRKTLLLALCCVPMLAMAAEEDEDIRFEESLRGFGFTSGAAYQCASERGPRQRPNPALKAYSGLIRLFGSDQAFLYAAAFGAGSTMQIDRAKCAEYTASFNKSMQKQTGK